MTTSETGSSASGRRAGRDLRTATIVGVLLAVAAFGTLVTSPLAFTLVIVVLMALAAVELGRVLRPLGRGIHVDVLLVVGPAWLLATQLGGPSWQRVGYPVLLLAAVLRTLATREPSGAFATIATTVVLGLWTAGLATHALLLLALPGGRTALIGVLGAVALADTGAYGIGSAIGRHRLAPSISPNKTWEGLAGGLAVAALGGAFVLPLIDPAWSAGQGVVLAVAAALAGAVGDLAESMLKRDLGVKDLGSVIAGHGGVLDRVDGILFALPVGHLVAVLLLR